MTYVQAPAHRVPAEGESLFRSSRPDYKIDANGCWIWQKARSEQGYPSGRRHRDYYARAYGEIPAGHHIHHVCRMTSCVNPEHLMALEARTHHIEDFLRRDGRSIEFVKQIREEGRKVGASVMEVASRYGVHHKTVQFYWDSVSWSEFLDDGPVITPRHVCALDGCDNVCSGPRHKRYCCPAHRAKAGHQRRRRGLHSPGGSNGLYFSPEELAA